MANGSVSAGVHVWEPGIDWRRGGLYALLMGLMVYAFWVQPVQHDLTCSRWLIDHWRTVSNYSHGPLIPLIASFLLWWNVSDQGTRRGDWRPYWRAVAGGGAALGIWLVGSAINPAWENSSYGLALLLLPIAIAWQVWELRGALAGHEAPHPWLGPCLVSISILVYYIGVKAIQPRVVVIAGICLLYGLALSLRGRDVFRQVFFPISFLFLMVPLNFLEEIVGFPLRMFVAKASTAMLNWFGIEAIQRGSGIISSVFRFDIADPCSGIRSLMALTTITAGFAYVTQRAQWKRWVLFASAMPLAVLGNLARVLSIALVAQVYGQELATKVYHDWSGFILFPVALGAMAILGLLLNFNFKRLFREWTKPIEPPVTHE